MTTALVGYYEGDTLRLRYNASAAPNALKAYVLYEYDKEPGKFFRDDIPAITSFTTDRLGVMVEGDPAGGGGGGCKITGGGVFINPSVGMMRGQFYVRFVVARQGSDIEECLCCGYVYILKPSLTVGEHIEPGPGGGEGYIRTVTGTNPAAGAEVLETVPANAMWRLLSFSAVLVTAVAAANRSVHLVADDGTTANRRFFCLNIATQAASLTRTWLYFRGHGLANQASNNFADTDTATVFMQDNLPDKEILPEAYRIRTLTGSIQAADDFAAPIFQVEEWLVL